MKKATYLALLTLLLSARVWATPRMLLADDPDGIEIRAIAADFYKRLAADDRKGAERLLVASPEDLALLDAILKVQPAMERLRKSLAAHHIDDASTLPQDFFLNGFAKLQPGKLVMLNGDWACSNAGTMIDDGLLFQRSNNKWRIAQLSTRPGRGQMLVKYYTSTCELLEEIHHGVDAGEYADKKFAADLRARQSAILENLLPRSAPVPAAPSETAPPLTGLRQAFGQPFNSPALTRVIASLPGLPRLSASPDRYFIISYETGIELSFHLPGGGLQMIVLHAEGQEGLHQYPMQLPEGLEWGETRQAVEARLGRPSRISPGYATYARLGLAIDYSAQAPRDPQNPVAMVRLFPSQPGAPGPTTLPSGARPWLTFRLAYSPHAPQTRPAEDLDTLADPSAGSEFAQLLVSRKVLLDGEALENVSPFQDSDGSWKLMLRLTQDGGRQFRTITRANIGRMMAIVWDGKVLIAPIIRGEISRDITIDFPGSDGEAKCKELADQINADICLLR